VTVELARRLLQSGVPPTVVEDALLRMIERGVSLAQAIAERFPEVDAALERELSRVDLPSVFSVRPVPELVARLPAGLCERLLAVPVNVDVRSSRVDVAAVEALDPHLASEFAFHLDAPVRILAAPYAAMRAALSSLGQPNQLPSAPPIPLVRRSMAPDTRPMDTNSNIVITNEPADDAEPLSLWRSKPPSPHRPDAPRASAPRALDFEGVLRGLDQAAKPDEVVELLCDGVAPALGVVFAVRSGAYEAKKASPELASPNEVRLLGVRVGQPSVIESAIETGFYLGPLPNTPAHDGLRARLPEAATREVYAAVVMVSERPSLVLLVAGFTQALDTTRRADQLADAAGRALERIVRSRKGRA
jgi:MshEN domain